MKDSKFDETIEESPDTGSGSSSGLLPAEDAPQKAPLPLSNGEPEPPDKTVKCPHCNKEIETHLEVDSEADPLPLSNGEPEPPDKTVKCPHCNKEVKVKI